MYKNVSKKSNTSTPIFRKKPFLLVLGLLLIAVIAVTALEVTNTTYIFHKKKVPVTIPVVAYTASSTQSTKASSATSGPTGPTQTPTETQSTKVASSGGGSSGATGSTTQTLAQPYGSFVSNHMPGQGGRDPKEHATCDTTPGATCYIQFTNTSDGTITKLPSQTVGSDGSTIWNWDANTLTTGEWRIT